MKSILIFENEYTSVKGAFETANLMFFDDKLNIVQFHSSQSYNFSDVESFSAIFIDIDLSKNSVMDGFGIISKLASINPNLVNRVVILTGNNKIKEAMMERSVYHKDIQIILKPTEFNEIGNAIKKAFKQQNIIL